MLDFPPFAAAILGMMDSTAVVGSVVLVPPVFNVAVAPEIADLEPEQKRWIASSVDRRPRSVVVGSAEPVAVVKVVVIGSRVDQVVGDSDRDIVVEFG